MRRQLILILNFIVEELKRLAMGSGPTKLPLLVHRNSLHREEVAETSLLV